jgi:hypothetical protein
MRPTGWIPERPGAQILGAHDFEQIGSFPAEGGFDAEPWILDQVGEAVPMATGKNLKYSLFYYCTSLFASSL